MQVETGLFLKDVRHSVLQVTNHSHVFYGFKSFSELLDDLKPAVHRIFVILGSLDCFVAQVYGLNKRSLLHQTLHLSEIVFVCHKALYNDFLRSFKLSLLAK